MTCRNVLGVACVLMMAVALGMVLGRVTAPACVAAAASEAASEAAPAHGWLFLGATPGGGMQWMDCLHGGGVVTEGGRIVGVTMPLPGPEERTQCKAVQHEEWGDLQ